MLPLFTSLDISRDKTSLHRMNIYKDKGSPYQMPRVGVKDELLVQLSRIVKLTEEMQLRIGWIDLLLKPKTLSTFVINPIPGDHMPY